MVVEVLLLVLVELEEMPRHKALALIWGVMPAAERAEMEEMPRPQAGWGEMVALAAMPPCFQLSALTCCRAQGAATEVMGVMAFHPGPVASAAVVDRRVRLAPGPVKLPVPPEPTAPRFRWVGQAEAPTPGHRDSPETGRRRARSARDPRWVGA